MAEITTLEQAQAEILRLQEENTALTNERDTLSQNNETLTQELKDVRTLNQTYFNKLQAQYDGAEGKKDEEEEDPPSCEAYAKTIYKEV